MKVLAGRALTLHGLQVTSLYINLRYSVIAHLIKVETFLFEKSLRTNEKERNKKFSDLKRN